MNQVQELVKALIASIKESEEYGEYQRARQKISQYPALKRQADTFRRKSFDMQLSGMDIFYEGDQLKKDFEAVLKDPAAWEYLNAENAFCRILRQVNWQILESLDFEMDFDN